MDIRIERTAQVVDHNAALAAMQLHDVEVVVDHARDNRLRHVVDEDTYAFRPNRLFLSRFVRTFQRRVVGNDARTAPDLTDIAGTVGPEDESNPVDTQVTYRANVLGFAQATYLYNHNAAIKFPKAKPGWPVFIKFSPMRKPR